MNLILPLFQVCTVVLDILFISALQYHQTRPHTLVLSVSCYLKFIVSAVSCITYYSCLGNDNGIRMSSSYCLMRNSAETITKRPFRRFFTNDSFGYLDSFTVFIDRCPANSSPCFALSSSSSFTNLNLWNLFYILLFNKPVRQVVHTI